MRPLPELQCPWCGAEVAQHDGVDPTEQPHAGAVSCCYRCGKLGIFTNTVATGWGRVGLGLRRATLEEAEEISGLPEVAAMLAMIRRDPTRRMPRGPEDARPVVERWRGRLVLGQPLPPLREVDPPGQ